MELFSYYGKKSIPIHGQEDCFISYWIHSSVLGEFKFGFTHNHKEILESHQEVLKAKEEFERELKEKGIIQ